MAESATLSIQWLETGQPTIAGNVVCSSDQIIRADVALINGVVTEDFGVLFAGLKGIVMVSSVAVSIVCKNAGGSTIQTIALPAGIPYAWASQLPAIQANPFSDDIATMVCTASAVGTLNIRAVQDSTP